MSGVSGIRVGAMTRGVQMRYVIETRLAGRNVIRAWMAKSSPGKDQRFFWVWFFEKEPLAFLMALRAPGRSSRYGHRRGGRRR
jgi:hypothetical protein